MLFFALLPTFFLAVMAMTEPMKSLDRRGGLEESSQLEKRTSLAQPEESGLKKRTSLTQLYGPQYLDPAFADLHFATLDGYNVLVTACRGYNVAAAINAFVKFNVYLITVFSKCRLAWYYNSGLALSYVGRFFTAIRELQVLLRLVSRYPDVMLKCRPTFQITTLYMNYIIGDMRKARIEFSGPVKAYAGVIDYSFFSYVGLTLGF